MAGSKLRLVWYVFSGGCVMAAFVLALTLLARHWNEPNLQRLVIGYAVDWIPFALTILIAFLPDLKRHHVLWRLGIVALGLLWSGLLAKERYFSMTDQQELMTAVTQSTEHTDAEIKGVRTDLQTDLDARLGNFGKGLATSLSQELRAPDPKFATLKFNFYDYDENTISLHSGIDGTFALEFLVTNIADVAAQNGDLWVHLCVACTFAEEPGGFDKPTGIAETVRHKQFVNLNSGASLEKMTIKIKPNAKFQSFVVGWDYSCQTCGKKSPQQIFTVRVLPDYKITVPNLKAN